MSLNEVRWKLPFDVKVFVWVFKKLSYKILNMWNKWNKCSAEISKVSHFKSLISLTKNRSLWNSTISTLWSNRRSGYTKVAYPGPKRDRFSRLEELRKYINLVTDVYSWIPSPLGTSGPPGSCCTDFFDHHRTDQGYPCMYRRLQNNCA